MKSNVRKNDFIAYANSDSPDQLISSLSVCNFCGCSRNNGPIFLDKQKSLAELSVANLPYLAF